MIATGLGILLILAVAWGSGFVPALWRGDRIVEAAAEGLVVMVGVLLALAAAAGVLFGIILIVAGVTA